MKKIHWKSFLVGVLAVVLVVALGRRRALG